MRTRVSEPEYDANFDQLWLESKSEFLKCETLPIYREPGEEDFLALFRAGKIEELREKLRQDVKDYSSLWNDARRKGLAFNRVHVFSKPLSEYLQFELVAYRVQAEAGEKIWMTPLESLSRDESASLKDFMLFDMKKALIVDHHDGRITGATVTDEPEDIERLVTLRGKLIVAGIPLEQFQF